MENNRKGIIVYSYDELKKLVPESGSKGMWAFHANCHEGHIRCAKAAQHCDWVVGMLFNNMADGERWMTGTTTLKNYPITQSDVDTLKKYSDVCLIFKDDYHPYKEHWKLIQNEFSEQFPIECLKEKEILLDQSSYNALLFAVAFRVLLHGVYGIYFDYQAQCGKDRYRTVGYVDYVFDRWGVKLDLIDSIRDEFGNSISNTINGLPKSLKDKINKPLLISELQTIDELRTYIKSIDGLKVLNFYRINGWLHATFEFEGYKSWVEGIRCKC
jgi:hypothetical protein